MIIPFDCEDLFELNDNLQPQFEGKVIIIDNIFKNYKQILDVCNNLSVEKWKSSDTSRNFVDYYDCKPIFNNYRPDLKKINKRLNTLLSITNNYYNLKGNIQCNEKFEFNYFKHKKLNVPDVLQHYPHYDFYYNCIFYIDPFVNGGTSLYKNVKMKDGEHDNLLYDISSLEVIQQISSFPNRCVIFPGNILHGGYIKDHSVYYYNWRINLVHFLTSKT